MMGALNPWVISDVFTPEKGHVGNTLLIIVGEIVQVKISSPATISYRLGPQG